MCKRPGRERTDLSPARMEERGEEGGEGEGAFDSAINAVGGKKQWSLKPRSRISKRERKRLSIAEAKVEQNRRDIN